MKNEKKVEARIATANSLRFLDVYVLPLCKKPDIISAYGYDYIREDKCDKIEREYNKEFIKVNGKEYMSVECHNTMDMVRMNKYEKHKYKLGDVVRLKSGSPEMTIAKIDKRENMSLIHTIWFDNEISRPEQRIGSFEDVVLEKVEKEYIECDGYELDCNEVDCDMCEDIEEKIDEKSQYYNPIIVAVGKIKEYNDKDISEFCKEVAREAYRDGASWMYDELTK